MLRLIRVVATSLPRRTYHIGTTTTTTTSTSSIDSLSSAHRIRDTLTLGDILKQVESNLKHLDGVYVSAFFAQAPKKAALPLDEEEKKAVLRFCEASTVVLESCNARTLVTIIHGVCKLDVMPSATFVRAWRDAVLRHMGELRAHGLSRLIYAVSKLKLKDVGVEFFQQWADACTGQSLTSFGARELSLTIYALGTLELGPLVIGGRFFEWWARAFNNRRQELCRQDRVQAVFGLSRLKLDFAALGLDFLDVNQNHTRAIRDMVDLDSVLEYAKVNAADFNEISSSALFSLAWKKSGSFPLSPAQKATLGEIIALIEPSMSRWDSRALASVMYGLAKLDVVPGAPFLTFWKAECCKKFSQFNEQEIANTIYALGSLSLGETVLGADFFQQWAAAANVLMERFNSQERNNILFALNKLQLDPSALRVDFSSKAYITSKMRDIPDLDGLLKFAEKHVLNGISASAFFSQAWKKPHSAAALSDAQRAAMWRICGRLVPILTLRFNARSLVTMMYCLAKLSMLPSDAVLVPWAEAMKRRLEECDAQELANICWALGKLRLGPASELGNDFFERWANAAQLRMDQFTPQGLTSALWGLSRLSIGPSVLGVGFFQNWAACASSKVHLGDFSAEGFSKTIHALAVLDLSVTELGLEFFAAWGEAFRCKLERVEASTGVNSHILTTTVWSLGKLGLGPPEVGLAFFESWVAACQSRWQQFTGTELVNTITSVSKLGLPDSLIGPAFFSGWASACARILPQLSGASLSALSWVLKRTHYDFAVAWMLACSQQQQQQPFSAFSDQALVYCVEALASFWSKSSSSAPLPSFEQWFAASEGMLARLTDSLLVCVVQSVNRLELDPPAQWVAECTRVCKERMPRFSLEHLVEVLSLLETLRKDQGNRTAFLKAWADVSWPNVPSFHNDVLVTVICALGRHGASSTAEMGENLKHSLAASFSAASPRFTVAQLERVREALLLNPDLIFLASHWVAAARGKLEGARIDQVLDALRAVPPEAVKLRSNTSGAIMGALLSSADVGELLRVGEENAQALDNYLVSVFFAQLCRRPRGPSLNSAQRSSLLRTCSIFEPLMASFTPSTLTMIIAGLARVSVPPSPDFLERWSSTCATQMRAFNARELGYTISALGKLRLNASQALSSSNSGITFLESWFECAILRLPEFTSQGLATAIFGLSRLRCEVPDSFIRKWSARCLENMQSFSEQEVSMVIWGASDLALTPAKLQPSFFWCWSEVAKRFVEQGAFSDRNMAKMLFCLGELGVAHEDRFFVPGFFVSCERVIFDRLFVMDVDQLTWVIYALGRMQRPLEPKFVERWCQALLQGSRMLQLEPVHLRNLIQGVALLRLPLKPTFFQQWADACLQKLPEFNAQNSGRVIHAIASLELDQDDVGKHFFSCWAAWFANALEEFSPANLAQTLLAVGSLGPGAPSLMDARLYHRVSSMCAERAHLFKVDQAAAALYGLALWDCALGGSEGGPSEFTHFATHLISSNARVGTEWLRNSLLACRWFSAGGGGGGSDDLVEVPPPSSSGDADVETIIEALSSAHVDAIRGRIVGGGRPDLVIPSARSAVFVHPPSHFTKSGALKMHHMFEGKLVERCGYNVMHV